MKPSEPSAPGEADIRPADAAITATPERGPTTDPHRGERVLSLLVLPDPARCFSCVQAFLVLGCCTGCVWLALNTGGLVSFRDARDSPSATDGSWAVRVLSEDMACNFVLGLAPACPLILLYQYCLKGRRSWPRPNEWLWLLASLATLMIFETAIPRALLDTVGNILPRALESFLGNLSCFGSCFLPLVWLLLVIVEVPKGLARLTWTDWLAFGSVPLLLMVLFEWTASLWSQWGT